MKTKQLPLDKLIPYAGNPRKNDHAVEQVAAAIKRFGFRVPVLAKSDGSLIDGHLRVKAAKHLGMEEVPVVLCDDLSEADIKALRISINRMAELADWDSELLSAELEGLAAEGFTLEDVGFDAAALEELGADLGLDEKPEVDAEPQIDKAEELRAKWGVETGQLWQLGDHRLLCGDSTKKEDVERVMGGEKAGLLVTDPPYNVEYEGNYIQSGKILKKAEKIWSGGIANDNREDFASWLASVFESCDLALIDGAGIYVWHPSGEDGKHFWAAWPFDRWHFQVDLVWNKTSLIISRWDYKPQHEPCMYGWKGKNRRWIGPNNEPTVWDIPRQQGSSGETRGHPTQKPVECMARPIRNHDSEFVYEPFSGSGTTIIACEQLGRKCRAIEISPSYVAVALQRWSDATGKTPRLVA